MYESEPDAYPDGQEDVALPTQHVAEEFVDEAEEEEEARFRAS